MATTKGIRIISTDPPTPQEQKHSLVLDLWCENTIEPEEEADRRRQAIILLGSVCKSWIHKTYVDEFNLPASDDVGGRIFATGSYRYNAHSSGSDIDVVLIAPERLTLQHFTQKLPQVLRAISAVTDMTVIAEARVPLIAMKIHGIDFDLSFGNVCRPRVPDDQEFVHQMLDDRILIGLTPQSTKAANAVRVADLLIKSVPSVAVFRQVLRFVKVWAKARGVYSFKIGFPSGIGWAILCAKICQCYPNKNGAGTIFHFFAFYSAWFRRNPTPNNPNRAIFLTASHTPPVDLRREGVEPSWNPKERMKDARALFPVLTPAYPYQDSCDNVSMTTLSALCDEFHRAHEVVRKLRDTTLDQIPSLQNTLQKALENKREAEREATVPGEAFERGKEVMKGVSFGDLWESLLERYPFFTNFTHYIRITISASHPLEYRPWVDMMEAKVCALWKEMKINKGAALESWAPHLYIRPNNVMYEEPSQQAVLDQAKKEYQQAENAGNQQKMNEIVNKHLFSAHFYIGVRMAPGAKLATPQDPHGINFPKAIQSYTERTRDNQAKFTTAKAPHVEIVKRADLPNWLPGWKSEEEILKMEEEKQALLEKQDENNNTSNNTSSAPSVLTSSSVIQEAGSIRQRQGDEISNEQQQQEAEMKRKEMLAEKMKKDQAEQEAMKRREQLEKEREVERLRKLQEEQQRKQQTEVESLMGFDF